MRGLSRVQVFVGALVLAASMVLAPSAGWSQPTSPQDWEAPRTAWGDPDIGGRPAIDDGISQFGGHSRGRWEGDTLVVETTNFGHRAYLFSSGPGPQGGINWDLSPALRVVERFTRVGPRTLDYQFTVDDPNVWTRPWTGSSPWALSDQPMFEYACHEGNYGLMNILAGSRVEEARTGEQGR